MNDKPQRFAFQTLDRLKATDECYDCEEDTNVILRPTGRNGEYRRYERTTEIYQGLPLFKEVS